MLIDTAILQPWSSATYVGQLALQVQMLTVPAQIQSKQQPKLQQPCQQRLRHRRQQVVRHHLQPAQQLPRQLRSKMKKTMFMRSPRNIQIMVSTSTQQ